MYRDTKYKRLEKGTFRFPSTDQKSLAISSAELMRLLEGLEVAAACGPR
jgi:transposase